MGKPRTHLVGREKVVGPRFFREVGTWTRTPWHLICGVNSQLTRLQTKSKDQKERNDKQVPTTHSERPEEMKRANFSSNS